MNTQRKIGTAMAICLAAALVLLANRPATQADELPGRRVSPQSGEPRIDQPPTGQLPSAPPTAAGPSGSSAYGAIGGGSFPRSFQIPGTSTSVRIGGSIDESLRSRLDR